MIHKLEKFYLKRQKTLKVTYYILNGFMIKSWYQEHYH